VQGGGEGQWCTGCPGGRAFKPRPPAEGGWILVDRSALIEHDRPPSGSVPDLLIAANAIHALPTPVHRDHHFDALEAPCDLAAEELLPLAHTP